MIVSLEKTLLRVKFRLLRLHSINSNNIESRNSSSKNSINHDVIDQSWNATSIRHDNSRSLKIAIIGQPNVGKSTLINQLVSRPICAASSKAQTTRVKSDAIFVDGNTQLVIMDTPGLVTNRDLNKFRLESSFKTDVQKSIDHADMVGVVQDSSHPFKSSIIDERVMAILQKLKRGITSILILNKVDKVKKKKKLLELVDILTSEKGWPNFSDVFMISALQSDGIEDLRNYLLDSAKSQDWSYDRNKFCNDPTETIITRIVRAKFMDALPQELPYLLKIETEHVGILPDESMSTIVSVACPTDRISKVIMGKGGIRVKSVAREAEQELCQAFRTSVRLKISIKFSREHDEAEVLHKRVKNP